MLPFPNPNPHTLSVPFTSTDLIEIDPFPSISNSSFLALSPCIDILPFDAAATTMIPQLDPLLVLTNYTSPPLMMRRRPDKVRGPRKDRHSKIVTAKGPRDRRIRLSREVARNFFDLQEMLGFEHGSKTVQWLLTMSEHAIQELNTTTTSPFIIGENDCKGKAVAATTLSYPSESIEKKQRQVAIEPARVIYINNNNDPKNNNHTDTFNYELLISKESRAQARERSERNRTTQKKRSNCCVSSSKIAPTSGAAKVDLHLTELVDREGSSAECSVRLGFTAEEGDFDMVPIYDCWTSGENIDSMEDISFQVQDIWRNFY